MSAICANFAKAIIAHFLLRLLRISHINIAMNTQANLIIDALGGTSAVAKLIHAPVSTVHSWRHIGIPKSRMAHLALVAQAEGKQLPVETQAA